MAASEPSHHARLARAREHLETLTVELQSWLEVNGPFPLDHVDEHGVHVVSVEAANPVPVRLGVLAGDVLHNLRSALDHLVYDLTAAHSGSPVPAELAEVCEFPIFADEQRYRRRGQAVIRGVAPAAQAAIERLQPWQAGADFARHPLWLLYRLSNIDKHRRPALAQLAIGEPETHLRRGSFEFYEPGSAGPLVYGAGPLVLARYRGDPPDEIDAGWGFTYGVAFIEPDVFEHPLFTEPPQVLWLLFTLTVYIEEEVLRSLEVFLGGYGS